ncbi:hypothetical protein FACS1894211_02670 [Clostridia bacterium]|nr:hypothetical protein FACS1894211_02670 [Clostridia bacterium]
MPAFSAVAPLNDGSENRHAAVKTARTAKIVNLRDKQVPCWPGNYGVSYTLKGLLAGEEYLLHISVTVADREQFVFTPVITVLNFDDSTHPSTLTYLNSENTLINHVGIKFLVGYDLTCNSKYLTSLTQPFYISKIKMTCKKIDDVLIDITYEDDSKLVTLPMELGSYVITFSYPGDTILFMDKPLGDENNLLYEYVAQPVTCTIYYNVVE